MPTSACLMSSFLERGIALLLSQSSPNSDLMTKVTPEYLRACPAGLSSEDSERVRAKSKEYVQ